MDNQDDNIPLHTIFVLGQSKSYCTFNDVGNLGHIEAMECGRS